MAFKTITIDLEAYELLRSRKAGGQSFSQVIKSGMKRGGTGRELAEAIGRIAIEEKTLTKIDSIVAERRKSRARRVRL
jgi:predicted CopG family antitoxin